MSYVPQVGTVSASWLGSSEYAQPTAPLQVSWAEIDQLLVPGFDASAFGNANAAPQQFIAPPGLSSAAFGSPAAIYPWQYQPSTSVRDGLWLGAEAYLPLDGVCNGSWTVPGEDLAIGPVGQDFSSFGSAAIWNKEAYVSEAGGSQHTEFGTAWLNNKDQYILHGGKPSSVTFGDTNIFNRDTYVLPTLGDQSLFGVAALSGGVRIILVPGQAAPNFGTTWFSFSPRFVTPASVTANFYTNHLVGTHREVAPIGFDASRFGERITPEVTVTQPGGVLASGFGETWVSNYRRVVSPSSFRLHQAEEVRFGYADVWNSRQFVFTQYDVNDGLAGEVFGIWTKIENRNRVVRTHSTSPGPLPSPLIENKARPLLPQGISAPVAGEFEKQGSVTHRVRMLHLDGMPPPHISRWSAVWNSAQHLRQTGAQHSAYGNAALVNTRRFFNNIGGADCSLYGKPMVSDGIRFVSFESRYSIEPPRIALPDVKLNTRYIEAHGTDAYRTGGHALHIHWNIARPRWPHDEGARFGLGLVRNLTPELRHRGGDAAEFGRLQIRTQWRVVSPSGEITTRFGNARIGDRNRVIEAISIGEIRLSDKLRVELGGGQPPSLQWITILSNQSIGYRVEGNKLVGQPVDDHGYGEPTVGGMSVHPEWADEILFGTPHLRRMGVFNAGVGPYLEFPPNPTVAFKNRTLDLNKPANVSHNDWDKVVNAAMSGEFPGKPTLNPRTIWAVKEAPSQAIVNHPITSTHPMHYIDESPSGGWVKGVGTPFVGNRYRSVTATGSQHSIFGAHVVRNRNIVLYPDGMKPPMFSRPSISGHRRYVQVINEDDHGFAPEIASPLVTHGVQLAETEGIPYTTKFGAAVVDYYNRFVAPHGWDSRALGASKPSDTPYQWQGLRVGSHVPNIIGGFDTSIFGEPFTSHKVRGVDPEGFEAFVSDYDFFEFAKRMRVRTRGGASAEYQVVRPSGVDHSSFVHNDVRHGSRHLVPDGNMDNFRKGAPNA